MVGRRKVRQEGNQINEEVNWRIQRTIPDDDDAASEDPSAQRMRPMWFHSIRHQGRGQVLWVKLCLPRMRTIDQFKAGGDDDDEE
jgi:hypothetical protein